MKARKNWYILASLGVVVVVVPLISALVTATGAFGADPSEKVNRMDFVWAGGGLTLAIYCFYKSRSLHHEK